MVVVELQPKITRGRSVCRSCGARLSPFVDLGVSPLCESFLTAEQVDAGETFYPLNVKVCGTCWLAQLGEFVEPQEIFGQYAYFSSYSEAWLSHARSFSQSVIARFGLEKRSLVMEIGSNDGYLLKNFVERGIPCLGIEPARNVAEVAQAASIPTEVKFFNREFGLELARKGERADLVIANNVLAQVPDLNDFVAGLRALLGDTGALTAEVPHLMHLIEQNQFDTIYHEHFSYFSFQSLEHVLRSHGLRVFDVEELWTHGGSLRIFACPLDASYREAPSVGRMRVMEKDARLQDASTYSEFAARVVETKWKLLDLLIQLKRGGARIIGYGAPGKANTLLNYCGIRTDFIDFTVDRNPYKHGRYLPGSRIPVLPPKELFAARPDYVMILPWNLKSEIVDQLANIREWGGRFVVPIPEPCVID